MPLSGPPYPKLSMCFEGAWLTQLFQLVTAGRLFLVCKGQVDPLTDECLYHEYKLWSRRILTPSKPSSCCYGLDISKLIKLLCGFCGAVVTNCHRHSLVSTDHHTAPQELS